MSNPRETIRPFLVAFLAVAAAAVTQHIFSPRVLAQQPPERQSSGLINPRAAVFNPIAKKVYIVDTGRNAVQVIDTDSQAVHAVTVGAAPVALDADTSTGRVYVANAGDGTVSILDGGSDAVLATVPVGPRPYSIAVNSRTGKAYITHTFSDKTSVLDGRTHAVTQLATGSIDQLAVDPEENVEYLLAYEGGNLTLLEGAQHAMRKAAAGKHAWGMTLNEATHTLYVARLGTGDVIALQGGRSAILKAGRTPCAVAVNPRTNMLYVANYAGGDVTVIDAAAGRTVATAPVGEHPQALAVDAQRNLVYVANTFSNTVTVIDGATRKAVATLAAGKAPYALAVAPGSAHLYVANEAGDAPFTIVDTALPR